MNSVTALVLSALFIGPIAEGGGATHLQSCPSKFNVGPGESEYLDAFRSAFGPWRVHGHTVILRVIGQPALEEEWILTVYQQKSEAPFVELARAKRPLRGIPSTLLDDERGRPQVQIRKRPLASDLLTSLDQVAKESFLGVRIPEDYFEPPTSVCLDGTLYTFFRSQACGWISCREPDSQVDRLVQVIHALARFVESEYGDDSTVRDYVSKFLDRQTVH